MQNLENFYAGTAHNAEFDECKHSSICPLHAVHENKIRQVLHTVQYSIIDYIQIVLLCVQSKPIESKLLMCADWM